MNGLVILRKARIILLLFLVLICLTWAALFAIYLSHEWPHSSLVQKIVVVSLLSLYVFTGIIFFLMAVVRYCPWWDVVRMFSILVVHTGSSVLFTFNRPSFSCGGFGTETACKEFIFTIFVGCWVFSATSLCFAIGLVVMAFTLPPVEPEVMVVSFPLAGTEEDDSPSRANRFKASSPTAADVWQTSLSSTRSGLVTYDNELQEESLSPDRNASPVNSIHRVIPRPVESLQRIKDDDLPSNTGWFMAGSPTADERRPFLSSARTELVTYNNELQEGLLSWNHNVSPVNNIYRETIALEPPRVNWQNSEIRNSTHNNETCSHGGTIYMRNTPGGCTDSDSGSQHIGRFSSDSFRDSSFSQSTGIRRNC